MYQILKEHIDNGGNVGYIFDQSYSGNDAGMLALMASLTISDGIPRIAQIANNDGVRVVQ